MHNTLAHGYFKVDLKTVWRTIRGDVPKLQQVITQLLRPFADI